VEPEEHPLLITEALCGPRSHRERLCELLFETMRVPAVCLSPAPVLCLYSGGETTGVVLDCGAGCQQAVPVVEGFVISHAVQRTDIGGHDVTVQLARLLARSGHSFASGSELDVVREMKEASCYIAQDPAAEEDRTALTEHAKDQPGSPWGTYKLPDGTGVVLGPERFRAPEILFRPEILGSERLGSAALVATAIRSCDMDLRARLYNHCRLAGGSSLFPGFGQRLMSELRAVAPEEMKVRVVAPKDRATSAWTGGALIASLATFGKTCVSRQEYEQYGAAILHRRFFY